MCVWGRGGGGRWVDVRVLEIDIYYLCLISSIVRLTHTKMVFL